MTMTAPAAGPAVTTELAQSTLAHLPRDYELMGHLAIIGPPARAWSEDEAMKAPCGSRDGPKTRSDFPLRRVPLLLF